MPVSLVVSARKGDPAAFARLVEHWHPHLLPFVHHTLGGLGDTHRVLAAAYVRAYRALPRYQAHRPPGLWLHRIAFLAATDELRRIRRNPTRRGGQSEPHTGSGEAPPPWYRLGPDQRALAVMLDLEGFAPGSVAAAFDTEPSVVHDRVARARHVFAATGAEVAPSADPGLTPATPTSPAPGPAAPGTGPDNPTWSADDNGSSPGDPSGTNLDDEVARWTEILARLESDDPADFRVDLSEANSDTPSESEGAAPTAEPVESGEPAESGLATADTRPESAPVPALEVSEVVASQRCRQALGALSVPATPDEFWADLGRRLLAERESPAAPTLDPRARLAKAHPSEPGFDPYSPTPKRSTRSVATLADQADLVRPRRRRGPVVLAVLAVVAVGAVVWMAVRLGTSEPVPDGSVLAAALAEDVSAALAEGPYQSVEVSVEAPVGATGTEPTASRLMISQTGSWSVSATERIDQTTYDAAEGILRRVAVVGAPGADQELTLLATEERGLATGPPDVAAPLPAPLEDLRLALAILRSEPEERARPTTVRETSTWTYTTTAATGEHGSDERWRIVIRQADRLPMVIERMAGETLVRRTDFSAFQLDSSATSATFLQPFGDDVQPTITDHGFLSTDLSAVPLLGQGEAVTPAWLPDGFALAGVAVRQEAPLSARPSGDGQNPTDRSVASMTFQRGIEQITVTTRAAGEDPGRWRNPFPEASAVGAAFTDTIGDGRFNGADVSMRTTAVGGTQLWGVHDGVVFTVGGDLTADEARRVAATLR